VVTRQEIDESDDVVYLVVDELIRLVNAHPADEQVSFVRTLSPGRRAIWGVFMVDGEVNNGGFNQFFWNNSRDFLDEARAGLQLLGAHEQLALLNEAVRRFESTFDERLRPYYERTTIEAFSESYDENLFGDLDERYFELDTYARQEEYIRSHPDEFVTP
jgi:hypothetical protein